MKSLETSAVRATAIAATLIILLLNLAAAQQQTPANSASQQDETVLNSLRDLQEQVHQLRALIDDMRTENAQSRAEVQQLHQEVQSMRDVLERTAAPIPRPSAQLPAQPPTYGLTSPEAGENTPQSQQDQSTQSQSAGSLEDRVQKLEESTSLLDSKIEEQHQTKVETASKYRARLSGIVLMNVFRNQGASNNFDLPDYAQPTPLETPNASLGFTMRQSEIGLEIFGPTVAGAKTSADVQFDFAGGFPAAGNGVNFGIVRLQTASLRFNWEHTSVVAGQDSLFVSPLTPTSFASLATPTFAYAGNLWGWTPQLRIEHRFDLSEKQTLTLQGGILDNLDWEFPPDSFSRAAHSGERSGQPAYGVRTAWSRPVWEHPLIFGVAGYYGRQDWTFGRYVDAWAGMLDWQIPLAPRVGLSGEFYRGRGIGGLGAAEGRSVVYGADPRSPYSPLRALNDTGGWSQLKFQLTPKLELNGVFSDDNTYTADVRGFAIDQNNFVPILGRNRGMLANLVFRPRSDLLFSAELRHLRSFPVYSNSSVTNQVNLAMGILF